MVCCDHGFLRRQLASPSVLVRKNRKNRAGVNETRILFCISQWLFLSLPFFPSSPSLSFLTSHCCYKYLYIQECYLLFDGSLNAKEVKLWFIGVIICQETRKPEKEERGERERRRCTQSHPPVIITTSFSHKHESYSS